MAFVKTAGIGVALAWMFPSVAMAQFVESDVQVIDRLDGDEVGEIYGWAGANLADLDGDGVQEFLISAVSRNNGAGRVTLYSGADRSVIATFDGPGAGQALGYAMAGAGDVDADGTQDFILGGGPVYVISGSTREILYELGATTGFGHAVSGAGDVNGDGYGDLFVGSERTLEPESRAGEAFMISGQSGEVLWKRDGSGDDFLGSGCGSLGDVDGDHIPDVIVSARGAREAYVLSGSDGALIRTLRPEEPERSVVYGQFFAAGAGDVDRDGIGDVFVADYAGLEGAGEAYVYSGRSGHVLHRFRGFDPGDGFGPGRGIPDVNGDGHADVFVAAYLDADGARAAGKAYLFSGRSGALLRTITSTEVDTNFGVDALPTGDINNDGLTDYLVTASGLAFAGTGAGRAYVIAGTRLPCPADLSGDGRVGFRDLFRLIAFARKNDIRGDLNGDRGVDNADFDVLLRDVGRCGVSR
ncbi:MAG: VCBS repeat-containing protein [Myxococcota bacterium]